MELVTRYRRICERVVILHAHHGKAIGHGLEAAGGVVAAAVLVLGEGVFHAVVVHPVGGVVVVVVVLVAPEVSLDDLSRLDAVAPAAVFALAVAVSLVVSFLLSSGESVVHARFVGRFAVAECGAQVVAVGARPGTLPDKAFDVVGCQGSETDLMAPATWLEWG